MKKIVMLCIGLLAVGLFAGCVLKDLSSEQKQKIVETGYSVGKKGVQTFVSEETRDKLHTKDLDKAVTTGYDIYKDVKNSEKK